MNAYKSKLLKSEYKMAEVEGPIVVTDAGTGVGATGRVIDGAVVRGRGAGGAVTGIGA